MHTDENNNGIPMKALAIFHDDGHGPWVDWFGRDGFRHCFVALRTEDDWIVFDADNDRGVVFEAVCGSEYDLAGHYENEGCTVAEAERRSKPFNPWWPFMAATCVGAAKKLLGIRRPWILTPWQLYRYLEDR